MTSSEETNPFSLPFRADESKDSFNHMQIIRYTFGQIEIYLSSPAIANHWITEYKLYCCIWRGGEGVSMNCLLILLQNFNYQIEILVKRKYKTTNIRFVVLKKKSKNLK